MSDKPSKNTHSTRTMRKYPTKDTRGQFHAELAIKRNSRRCPGCGGKTLLPCHKCYIDSLKETK